MRLKYLLGELEKLIELMNKSEDLSIESIAMESRKRDFIYKKVLPVIDREIEIQWQIATEEIERLLEGKDEKCKTNKETD